MIGDLNGDGKPDLAVACEASVVSVLLNTTAPGADPPTFAARQDIPTGPEPNGEMAFGDVNLDGKPDLIMANLVDNTLTVLVNKTAPGATTVSFDPKVELTTGVTPASAHIADMNGDGLPT